MNRIDKLDAQLIHNRAAAQHELLIWTIYERPRDFPSSYIARPHRTIRKPGPLDVHLEADSLEALRALLPAGLTCLERLTGDDAPILETWL